MANKEPPSGAIERQWEDSKPATFTFKHHHPIRLVTVGFIFHYLPQSFCHWSNYLCAQVCGRCCTLSVNSKSVGLRIHLGQFGLYSKFIFSLWSSSEYFECTFIPFLLVFPQLLFANWRRTQSLIFRSLTCFQLHQFTMLFSYLGPCQSSVTCLF